MKGDFSKWRFRPTDNFNAVLHQQGRVITDTDFTDAERIRLHWEGEAGRDIIGARVAAVPATDPNGFRIVSAHVDNSGGTPQVMLEVHPGKVWADGLLTYLPGTANVSRLATYFQPPVQSPAGTPGTIGANIRDAVILELSHEEMNAFQMPAELLEPALGDLDTTERAYTRFVFRLYRLGAGQTCRSIINAIQDGDAGKGRLTVSLTPSAIVPGDCPVAEGGGYTGFEHHLYRIEIAHTSGATPPHFKWSQFNGGLVGRGRFNAVTRVCNITGNRAAIINSNLTDFYLEALALNAATGAWEVTFGTDATLLNGDLQLTNPPFYGTFPGADTDIFFRLWNGRAPISAFTNAAVPPLRDDIHLLFDPATATNYRPGDYWTFPVRVGQTSTTPLINNQPPHGVRYHRVALAEIHWTAQLDTRLSGSISDCRRRFRPLTGQNVCCTLLVGDGVGSFGDFNSLEEAAAHLPPGGGELCMLPGTHYANLSLVGRRNITIHGCPGRTTVMPRTATRTQPILRFENCQGIRVEGLDLVSLDATPVHALTTSTANRCSAIVVKNCRILASTGNGIRFDDVYRAYIGYCRISMLDRATALAAISTSADEVLIERNFINVIPAGEEPQPETPDDPNFPGNPRNPCIQPDRFYASPVYVVSFVAGIWVYVAQTLPANPYQALGGIHVRRGSEEVRITENIITGGAGNGVTLGGELSAADAPSSDGGESERVVVTLPGSGFLGIVVDSSDTLMPGFEVTLISVATGVSHTGVTNTGGQLLLPNVPAGQYQVTVRPTHRLLEVTEMDVAGAARAWRIRVGPATTSTERLAQLYTIQIIDNEITLMGLSGIGFGRHPAVNLPGKTATTSTNQTTFNSFQVALAALFAPWDILVVANAVNDLTIERNRIHRNLRARFTDAMTAEAERIGFGGISLGVCFEAVVRENQILDNGAIATDPVCGVYVGYGENIVADNNVISGNGVVPTSANAAALTEGLRGGIVVRVATSGLLDPAGVRRPSLRIHDNRIDQPLGRGITAFCMGPMTCADNSVNSERPGRWNYLDAVVGGILIFNFGGLQRYLLALQKYSKGRFAAAEIVLPGGETLICNNQVRLGPANTALTSIVGFSLDDLGFDSNQTSVFQLRGLIANTMLVALTTRVTDSRFTELIDNTWSLVSIGTASNVTAHNQADHCIIATGPAARSILQPNVVLNPAGCGRFDPRGAKTQYMAENVNTGVSGANVTEASVDAFATTTFSSQYAAMTWEAQSSGQSTLRYLSANEANRLTAKHGRQTFRVQQAEERIARSLYATAEMTDLASVAKDNPPEPPPPDPGKGSVLFGRVTNAQGQPQGGLSVEVIRRDGTVMEAVETTDARGNYRASIDPDSTAELAAEKTLFVRVSDGRGKELGRSGEPVVFTAGATLRVDITLPGTVMDPADFREGRVVFNANESTEPTREAEPPVEAPPEAESKDERSRRAAKKSPPKKDKS